MYYMIISLYFLRVIYTYHFSLYLAFSFLSPLLINLLLFFFFIMWFLLYDSDSMSLRRYHFLPLFIIVLATLRAMLILVGGRVKKGSC